MITNAVEQQVVHSVSGVREHVFGSKAFNGEGDLGGIWTASILQSKVTENPMGCKDQDVGQCTLRGLMLAVVALTAQRRPRRADKP